MHPALFIDRDGVVNVNHGYVNEIDSFDFINGIFSIVNQANELGYKVIVITNQSGIGRGYFTEQQFLELTHWMIEEFKRNGSNIDDLFYCPHHPSEAKGEYLKDCSCRKPKPGLFTRAIEKHNIDVHSSIMIGDKKSDMRAAAAAGVNQRVLLGQDPKQSSEYQTLWLRQESLEGVEFKTLISPPH